MKTLNILAIVLLILYSTVLFGQTNKLTLGLESGPSLRTLRGDNFFEIRDLSTSFSAGISYQYNFTEHLSLRTGISYEQKGFKINTVQNYDGIINDAYYTVDINYLTIPIMAKYTFGKKIKYFVNAGAYFADLFNTKVSRDWAYGREVYFTNNNLKPIDIGITAGFGLSYPIKEKFLVSLELRNNFGLLDINSSNYNFEFPTRTFSSILLVGVAYKIADNS